MILKVKRPAAQPRQKLQQIGYAEFRDPNTGQTSYVRRLGTYFYPRFHLYLEEQSEQWILKFHLDQKQPSYGGQTKHSGEYDGPTVETEGERIQALF